VAILYLLEDNADCLEKASNPYPKCYRVNTYDGVHWFNPLRQLTLTFYPLQYDRLTTAFSVASRGKIPKANFLYFGQCIELQHKRELYSANTMQLSV